MRNTCLCILFALFLAVPVHAAETSDAEQAFFQAYDKLYQAAVDFEDGLKTVSPPEGFSYPEADLKDYHALLEELFTKKPEYKALTVDDVANDPTAKKVAKAVGKSKDELGMHKEAGALAGITGLPHRELAVYQKAKGTSGLRKLIYAVNNPKNFQWIAWYLVLTDNADSNAEKSLFLNDGAVHPEVAALREAYGVALEEFNQALDALLQADQAALDAASGEEKNRVAIRNYIHHYIAKKAGKAAWIGKDRAGYPYADPDPKRYRKAAIFAEKLGVEFSELAYIKRREGNFGLRKVLKSMTWVNGMDAMMEEVFK